MPEPMSAERLAEIRKREQAATEGPWGLGDGDTIGLGIVQDEGGFEYDVSLAYIAYGSDRSREVEEARKRGTEYQVGTPEDDAKFIAHARKDVPDLLTEVGRLRALVDEQGDLLGLLKAHAIVGAEADGSHHKQWVLIEIGRLLGVTWEEGSIKEGVEP